MYWYPKFPQILETRLKALSLPFILGKVRRELRRPQIFLLFKVILLVGIFYWVFKLVNIDEIITILSKTNLALFLIAFILYNCSNVFLTIKWHRLATPLKLKTGFLELLKLNYISVFYSIFIPGQASGELIKGLKLTQRESSSQKVWIPIFIDKITNLLIIFLMMAF